MTTTRDDHLFRELDHRESDGISVSLLWRRRDDAVAVAVHDECTDQSFRLRVAATKALDAFRTRSPTSSRPGSDWPQANPAMRPRRGRRTRGEKP
jgi:hypothetical protein